MLIFKRSLLAVLPLFVCAHVAAQSVSNGNFDDTAGALRPSTPGQMAPGWLSGDPSGTPDWDRPPGTIYPHVTVPPSPHGGPYMGMLGFDSTGGGVLTQGESILQANISGFTVGRQYEVGFHQINIPELPSRPNEDGYLSVSLFGVTKDTPRLKANSNTWSGVSLVFTANSTVGHLRIRARDANPGSGNTPLDGRAYMAVDGVTISPYLPVGPLRNFDVVNRTGRDANDFHLTLQGVTPDQVDDSLWLESYPDAEKTAVPGGTRITWRGPGTPNGGSEHFGYRLIGPNARVTGVEMEWTFDGVSIGRVAATKIDWRPLPDRGFSSEIRLDERWVEGEVFVSRRVARLPGEATLEDLVVGGPAWETAEPIDYEPVPLFPNEPLAYQFIAEERTDESLVVVYDLLSEAVDPGLPREELTEFLLATWFEAIPFRALDKLEREVGSPEEPVTLSSRP